MIVKYAITLFLSFALTLTIQAQNKISEERKNELLQTIKVEDNQNPYEIKPYLPEKIQINKSLLLKNKLRQNYFSIEPNQTQESLSMNQFIRTLPENYIDDYAIQKVFPKIKMDIRFKGGYASNRYNDPYYRNDDFTGNYWDRDNPRFGAGFAVGSLNLHDPKAWFTAKKRWRIAENARRITQWVYWIDEY